MIFGKRLDINGAEDWREAARRIEEHTDYMQQMLEMKVRVLEEKIRELEREMRA